VASESNSGRSLIQSRQSMRNRGILLAWLVIELKFSSVINFTLENEHNLPDCTGVNTGVTLVNSESKLLVSVALVMVGRKGG
jgi:hypothetical protein